VPYYSNATKVPEAGVASGNNVARKRDEQVARMQRCPKRFGLLVRDRWSVAGHSGTTDQQLLVTDHRQQQPFTPST